MNTVELHEGLEKLAQGEHEVWKAIFDHAADKVAETEPVEAPPAEPTPAPADPSEAPQPDLPPAA